MRTAALSKIAKHTGRWVNLTGTPATNGLTDLWGQAWFCDFGARLGRSYSKFMQQWFHVNEYTHAITPLPGAGKEIEAALADITFALRFEDWFTAKQPEAVPVYVEMPTSAQKLYDRMEHEFFAEMGETQIEAFNSAAKSMKLLQIAAGSIYDEMHVAHHVHDAKIEALEDVFEELGENLLVAYYFKFSIPRILRTFPHARVLQTDKDFEDWNAGKIRMGLVHYQSAGHGLSLQDGGRALAFFDQIWDLELRLQVLERLGVARQVLSGYNRAVLLYDIICRGTIELEVADRNMSKISVQDALTRARARRP